MPLNFHILDCFARDEKIMSETATEKVVQYTGDGDEDDEEFQTPARFYKEKSDKKDHANKSFIVHLFGKTADGTSVRADVRGFKPFFFVKAPDGSTSVHEKARIAVVQYLGRHIYPSAVANSIQVEKCRRKELFGFTQDREVNMLRITVPSKGLFNDVKNCFCNGSWEPELKVMRNGQRDAIGGPYGATAPMVYEANLDPMLRFLHLRNLKPCNWCTIEDIDEDEFEDDTVTLECNWEDIGPCNSPPRATAPFKIASWDIECMSTTGAFPVAAKGDPIIQIGTILGSLGEPETEKHIFVLGTCDKIPDGIVHTFKKEREMILAWCNWIDEQGIDILMGYNIFGFDERYLWDRAVFLGIEKMMEIQQLNRLHEEGQMMRLDEKRLTSSAMGDNFMWLWNTTGRLRVDLFHYIKRGYPLPSYKLDDTSRNFLGEAVKGIEQKVDGWLLRTKSSKSNQDIAIGRSLVLLNDGGDSLCEKVTVVGVEDGCITIEVPDDVVPDEVSKWAIVKDDVTPAEMFKMHQQGPKERAIVARYCIQDCQLVLDLFKKLDVFNNSMSMANVCSVPVGYIFLRGQGVKIESLMFKYCYERGQCIMVLPSAKVDGETYEGAIVLDPTPGFYTAPVGVADFASLYPSTIISENISHDTLVWVKDYNEKGELLAHVWGSDEYDNVEGQRYTDIEYDNMIDDPEDQRKVKRKIKAGIRVCRYAQDKIGTIPQIVAGLLAARKAKRKEGEKATDPFIKALLDSEQLAYKLTANSLYGQLGSGTFKVRLRPLAASVTAYGRKQIMFAKTAIEDRYGRHANHPHCCATADTVYGDSVKGDTAIFIKRGDGVPEVVRMDELVANDWATWHETKEAVELQDIQIWTEKGWTRVDRIIRHSLAPGKKMFRVVTHTGVVDCTEDHSLVAPDGKEVKPSEVSVGTELLHSSKAWEQFNGQQTTITENEAWCMGFFLADGSCDRYEVPSGGIKYSWAINKADIDLLQLASERLPFETKILDTLQSSGVYKLVPVGNLKAPVERYRALFYNQHREKRVPKEILSAPSAIVKSFMDGFYAGDGDKVGQALGNYRWDQKGKEVCTGLCILALRLGYSISLNDRASKPDVFRITCTKSSQRKNVSAIKKLYEISTDEIDYVYDLQTENHHFAVGPGHLVVHNTDSLFIAFNPRDPVTGKALEGKAAVEKTIELTEEAGKFVSKMLKAPHDFEFDKVYWPFIIFSKKRYVGHKYEDPDHPDKYKLAFMGVALKRRDYAPIVKRIYSSALNVMLHERNVAKAAGLVQQMTRDLVEGRFGLQPLIISKSLKSEYANPKSIAHKVLADRITARDPGNAPASGDRIPFIYIQPQVGQAAPDLQGDRIETPTYIKENGLKPDYMFYIDHQIANPVCQLFGVVVEQIPGFHQQPVPKGGWSEDPEKLAVQRETTAYNLLFADAITSNNKGAKRAFAKLFGAETTPATAALSTGKRAPRALPSSVAAAAPKKQSVLDSMFMDVLKVAASKEIQKQKKAEEKKKASAEDAAAPQPKQKVTRRLKGTVSAELKDA